MEETFNGVKYKFFWNGIFSNWYISHFEINGVKYNCTEQYMMHQKAKLFGDNRIADKIIRVDNQRNIKSLGRQVKNFDEKTWAANREAIVFNGNWLKFTQNPGICAELMDYPEGTVFVEASPYDRIWGIGFRANCARANRQRWGLNLLGKAITKVHTELYRQQNHVDSDDEMEQVDQVSEPIEKIDYHLDDNDKREALNRTCIIEVTGGETIIGRKLCSNVEKK